MFRKKPNESYLMLQLLRDIDIKLLLKRKCMGNGTIIFFIFCTCKIITHIFLVHFEILGIIFFLRFIGVDTSNNFVCQPGAINLNKQATKVKKRINVIWYRAMNEWPRTRRSY